MSRQVSTVAILLALTLGGCGRLGFDELADGEEGVVYPVAGSASMTLRGPWGANQGHAVLFHNPDGSLIDIAPTDANGMASLDIPSDAMITVADDSYSFLGGGGQHYRLFTIMGVQPDDALHLGSDTDPWDALGWVEITVNEAYPGASYYGVNVGCEQAWDTVPAVGLVLTLTRQCLGDATSFDVIAYAFDAEDKLIAHAMATDVAIAPDDVAYVDLPTWQTDLSNLTLNVSNPPPTADYVDIQLSGVAGGVGFYTSYVGDGFTAGAASFDLSLPAGFGTGMQYILSVYHGVTGSFTAAGGLRGGGSPASVSYIVQRHAGVLPVIDHDLSTDLLPTITTAWIDETTPGRPTLVTTVERDMADIADGGMIVLKWYDALQVNSFEWWILVPPGMTSVQLPALPDYLANYRPVAGSVFETPQVVAFDADFINGYGDARNTYGFDLAINYFALPRDEAWVIRSSAGPGGFGNGLAY